MAKYIFVSNDGSGKSHAVAEVRNRLVHFGSTDSIALRRGLDLPRSIAAANDAGCETVIAAGGDGTVNAVVNAMMDIDAAHRPKLAIIPLGTANDFAGTLAIPDELDLAVELVSTGQYIPMDVVRISASRFERYYANIAAGGNSVRVSEALTDELKATWGAFCYMRGAIGVLADMRSFAVHADCDGEIIEVDSWGVLVANGKTNAGRILVAPQASPADGLIDVIIIREGSVLDMAEIIAKTLLTSFLECDQVIFRQVRKLSLTSTPTMRFTLDGEVIDQEPVHFEVVPGAIQTVVGAEFERPIQVAQQSDSSEIVGVRISKEIQ